MTDNKRFTFANGLKIMAIKDNGQIMNSRQVCGLLNTLSNENEQLKKENKKLQGKYDKQLWVYNGLGCEYDWECWQKLLDFEHFSFTPFRFF